MEIKTKDVKEIVKTLENGITDFLQGDRYANFLKSMANFHGYSLNNTLLILMQCPEASLVASYKKWQTMGRQVKKGEKAITILCPCFQKYKRRVLDKDGNPVLDEDGNVQKEEISFASFRPGKVFDVSQTDGKPIETLEPKELSASITDADTFIQKLISVSPVPVFFDDIDDGAKGYFSPSQEKIVVQKGMSDLQTLKTLVHESAHARLHNTKAMEGIVKDRQTKEVEAESVAYCVLTSFGFDASEYSFPYIAGWSSGRDMKELKASLDTIRITSGQIIEDLQEKAQKIA